jgi:anti-anti-sigma regulatory factor
VVKVACSVLNPDLGDHVCLPFRDDHERMATARVFAMNGLRRRTKVMIVAHADSPERTRDWLAPLVPGFDEAWSRGRIEIVSSADVHFTGGRFDPRRVLGELAAAGERAREEGHRGLYALFDASWGVDDTAGRAAFESAANTLFGERWMAAVCHYDRRLFSGPAVERAAAVHPINPDQALLRFAGTWEPPGLRLSGDVDLTNRQALASVLAPLEAMAGEVVIDAGDLCFVDAGSAQLLVMTALARPGRRTVVVCGDALARLLRLIGADELVTVRRAGDV